MRGKTKESHYLITKLFATDYFYFYCKPLLFFTYFSHIKFQRMDNFLLMKSLNMKRK